MSRKITSDKLEIAKHRLEVMPSHLEIFLDSRGTFGKEELKGHLEKGDEIGEAYAKVQMAGLRAFKDV